MSLTQSAERAALNKLIDYLDDNPQENIDKIMDLVNKLVPDRVFPVQREAFTNVIKSRGNWYDLIMRIFSLNPKMRTKLLKALIVTVTCSPGHSKKRTARNTSAIFRGPSCSTLQVPATCIARAAGPPSMAISKIYPSKTSTPSSRRAKNSARTSTSIPVASHSSASTI